MDTTHIGQVAEDLATSWLVSRGMKIIERNARTRFFELDIVALDGDCVVFLEVKCRSSRQYGGGVGAISADKQRRLLAGSQAWLIERGWFDRPLRFDVVEVIGRKGNFTLQHITDCIVLDE